MMIDNLFHLHVLFDYRLEEMNADDYEHNGLAMLVQTLNNQMNV